MARDDVGHVGRGSSQRIAIGSETYCTAQPAADAVIDYGDHTRANAYSRLRYPQMVLPWAVERMPTCAVGVIESTSRRQDVIAEAFAQHGLLDFPGRTERNGIDECDVVGDLPFGNFTGVKGE